MYYVQRDKPVLNIFKKDNCQCLNLNGPQKIDIYFIVSYCSFCIFYYLQMWKEYHVSVRKNGRIYFDDVIDNIIKSSKLRSQLKLLSMDDAKYIGSKLYISELDAIKIIYLSCTKNSVLFCNKQIHCLTNIYNFSYVSEKYLFYGDGSIIYFEINDVRWYKAIDVCNIMNYKKARNVISTRVTKKSKMYFDELKILALSTNHLIVQKNIIDRRSFFIDQNGLNSLILGSRLPNSIHFAHFFDIKINQKFVRKETDIVCAIKDFCNSAKIKNEHLYCVDKENGYYFIDFYLPDHRIAIEIDENDHVYRNPKYEKQREKFIQKKLNCKFIRCNPDDPNFNIYSLLGKINLCIVNNS